MAIVGAGIHGAALARELSLRGVSCALIDIGEVGGGTSQWSTKLLHGGIRYLRTGDIAQMRSGLRERATWVRLAPWRCKWEAFWMPHRSRFEGITHRIGIGLYDRWGSERPGWPPELALGRVPDAAFRADPRSHGGPFRAAVAYADLMTWDGELTRDLAASSHAFGYDLHEITDWRDEAPESEPSAAPTLTEATLRDRRSGTTRTLRAQQWVFALGPWTDEALATWFNEMRPRLRLSAGIHLWFDAIPECKRPWTVMRDSKRVLFLIPRDGYMQAGTTEREVSRGAEPVTGAEREDLLGALAATFPQIPWRSLPVRHEESGVRPLVRAEGAASTLRISREAKLEHYPRFRNVRLVLGGKLTTARALMDRLATELTGRTCPASRTVQLKPGAPVSVWQQNTPAETAIIKPTFLG